MPGLFEGDDLAALMSNCRDGSQKEGVILDSEDELFRWFTSNVQRNLHVVFTMNPASGDFNNRAATSPALFNRCVVDWFGDWSEQAHTQVAYEFTENIDMFEADYAPSMQAQNFLDSRCKVETESCGSGNAYTLRDAVVHSLVRVHEYIKSVAKRKGKLGEPTNYVSPRDFLDLINHFTRLHSEKRKLSKSSNFT